MRVLCLNVCRLRVPNIMTLSIFKKLHRFKFGVFASYSQKRYFWCPV